MDYRTHEGQPIWRKRLDYTPSEALGEVAGWARSPARLDMHVENGSSLATDVVDGLAELVSAVATSVDVSPIQELLTFLRDRAPEPNSASQWDRLQKLVDKAVLCLSQPQVAVAVWDRMRRRFARDCSSASSHDLLAALDGALRQAGFSPAIYVELASVLRDNLMSVAEVPADEPIDINLKAGMPVSQRLDVCRERIAAGAPSGDRTVWLIFGDAGCSPFVIDQSNVTFFDGRWWQSIYQMQDFDRPELPPEVETLRRWLDPERLLPGENDDEFRYVLCRVELGEGQVATAATDARRIAEAMVSLSKLLEGSRRWKLLHGDFVVFDGRVHTMPFFTRPSRSDRPMAARELRLDSLAETSSQVQSLFDAYGETGMAAIDAVKVLNDARDVEETLRIRIAAEVLEGLVRLLGSKDPWPASIPRWFGHFFSVIDYRSDLVHYAGSIRRSEAWSESGSNGEWTALLEWGWDRDPANLVRLTDIVCENTTMLNPRVWAHNRLSGLSTLKASPTRLRKYLLHEADSFRRATIRALRVRNAITHGGFTVPEGVRISSDLLFRSAVQLTYEVVTAISDNVDPALHLHQLRMSYESVISRCEDDPNAAFEPVDTSTWRDPE